jgi:hypothetical protein
LLNPADTSKKIFKKILNIGTLFFKYDFKGFVVLANHDKHIEPQ